MLAGARILLTGATGRLGRHLAEEPERPELALVVCASSPEASRRGSRGAARRRADEAGDGTLRRRHRGRARPRRTGAGPAPRIGRCRHPRRSDDELLHAAGRGEKRQRRCNAQRSGVCRGAPRLGRVAHVSTAFVAGKRTGRILESDLEHNSGFQNGYQQSKYEAELLIRRYRELVPLVVFRPSVVLDANEPSTQQCRSAFRFAFELVRKGLLPALPGSGAPRSISSWRGTSHERSRGSSSYPPRSARITSRAGSDHPRLRRSWSSAMCVTSASTSSPGRFRSGGTRNRDSPDSSTARDLHLRACISEDFDTTRTEAALGGPVAGMTRSGRCSAKARPSLGACR